MVATILNILFRRVLAPAGVAHSGGPRSAVLGERIVRSAADRAAGEGNGAASPAPGGADDPVAAESRHPAGGAQAATGHAEPAALRDAASLAGDAPLAAGHGEVRACHPVPAPAAEASGPHGPPRAATEPQVPLFEQSVLEGCQAKLDRYFSTAPIPAAEPRHRLPVQYFTQILLRLAGSEVEANEIRLGILIGPRPSGEAPITEAQGADDFPARDVSLADARTALRLFRDTIIGRADGTLDQSLVLIDPAGARILGLYRVVPERRLLASTHDQYEAVTWDDRYLAIQLKPAATARIYSDGAFVAQVIRLRDGLGWSIRMVRDMVDTIRESMLHRVGVDLDPGSVYVLAELLCELSESRRGGAVYFVKDAPTFAAMCRLGKSLTHPELTSEEDRRIAGGVVVSSAQREASRLPITQRERETVLGMLGQDGAVVLTPDGRIIASRTYFVGPGGRREIARFLCERTHNPITGVVVSQDGPIYIGGWGPAVERGERDALWEVDEDRYA